MYKSLMMFCLISIHMIFGNIANAGLSIGYSENSDKESSFRDMKIHGILDLNISQLLGYRYVIENDLTVISNFDPDYVRKIHMLRFHLPLFDLLDLFDFCFLYIFISLLFWESIIKHIYKINVSVEEE